MGKLNVKTVFLGFFLISLALFLAVAAFYFLEVKPEMAKRQVRKSAPVASQVKTVKLIDIKEQKIEKALPPAEPQAPTSGKKKGKEVQPAPPLPEPQQKVMMEAPLRENKDIPMEGGGEEEKNIAVFSVEPDQPAKAVPAPSAELALDFPAYDEKERNRREGVLWVNPQGEYVVTLGRVQGLKEGKRLAVFSGNEKLGEVEVESVSDVVAYVRPLDEAVPNAKGKYFRAVIQ